MQRLSEEFQIDYFLRLPSKWFNSTISREMLHMLTVAVREIMHAYNCNLKYSSVDAHQD